MKKIDNLKPEELAEYIRNVLSETGPYQIDNWHMYQLKHAPTQSAIEKVNKVIAGVAYTPNRYNSQALDDEVPVRCTI